jgi:hypothetical protein
MQRKLKLNFELVLCVYIAVRFMLNWSKFSDVLAGKQFRDLTTLVWGERGGLSRPTRMKYCCEVERGSR